MNTRGGFVKGDPRAVAAGKRAGVVSGERRRDARQKRWEGFGIDGALAAEIRQSGYNSGWIAGYKAGVRKASEAQKGLS